MLMMKRPLLVVFLLAVVAGCTAEPDTADLGTAEQAAVASVECMDLCVPGSPCHHICFYFPATPDDRGPAVGTGGASKCDGRRVIDVCGDGCCDPDEAAHFPQKASCPQDCRVERIDVTLMEDRSIHLMSQERSLATVMEDQLVVNPPCQ
jgi:hypothetical protein